MFIESYFDGNGSLSSHDTLIEIWYVLSFNMPSHSFTMLIMLYHTSVIHRCKDMTPGLNSTPKASS